MATKAEVRVTAVFFCFPDRTSREGRAVRAETGERRSAPGVSKKCEKWEGRGEREVGRGVKQVSLCITSSHSTDSNHFKTNTRLLRIIVNLDFQMFFGFSLHTIQRCIRCIREIGDEPGLSPVFG